MIPAAFEYVRARSVEDARRLLAQHGDEAKLIAGGHSLIPMMKLRLATPAVVIDIGRVPGLATLEAGPGGVRLGALVRHAALAASEALRAHAPALWDAANELGDAQVRNRGTVGGACAHADPSADYPAAMLALDATFEIAGDAPRTVGADAFFRGMFESALEPDDVLTGIAFAAAPHSAYVKLHHPASHYAVAGAAANVTVAGGKIAAARVAITGVGDVAYRATAVERALAGVALDDAEGILNACAAAGDGVDARADHYAPAEYRAAMAGVFAARAVERAVSRAAGAL